MSSLWFELPNHPGWNADRNGPRRNMFRDALPAPTTAKSPMSTPARIVTLAPIHVPLPFLQITVIVVLWCADEATRPDLCIFANHNSPMAGEMGDVPASVEFEN